MGVARDIGLATSLMTAYPVPVRIPEPGERNGAAGWFVWAGLAVGFVPWVSVHVLQLPAWHPDQPLLNAAGLIIFMAIVTRGLHWDGLADVADAFWGGHTRERRLEIMADSAVGAFGVLAVVLVAIAETAAVAALLAAGHELPLLIVPGLARLAATFAAWFGKPARPGGLGASVIQSPTLSGALATIVGVAAIKVLAIAGFGVAGAWFCAGVILAALVVPHLLSMRFGGVTGDVMGASVLVTEALGFAAAAYLWGA